MCPWPQLAAKTRANELRDHADILLRVGDTDRIGGGLGGLECVRHGERNILAVVANNVILERRTSLDTNALKALSRSGAENLADVFSMKDRAHVWHFFRSGGVDLL